MQRRTEKEFDEHLATMQSRASRDNDLQGESMAGTLKAVAECIRDKDARRKWTADLLDRAGGREKYFGHRYRVATDPAVTMLSRLSGRKLPSETELMLPVIRKVSEELAESVSRARTVNDCKALAAKISAVGGALQDAGQKKSYVETLSGVIEGRESFKQKGAEKSQRDPCADAIEKLRS